MANRPPLKPLHPAESLSCAKLATIRKRSTDRIVESLQPGKRDALKTRPDGTILDGHHRLYVLCERGVNIDALPREVLSR